MKRLILILSLIFIDKAYSQNLQLPDSITKEIQTLKRNQLLLAHNVSLAGKQIHTGATMAASGIGVMILGGIMTAAFTLNNTKAGQYVGIGLTTGGFVFTLAGIFNIGDGGKRLHDL